MILRPEPEPSRTAEFAPGQLVSHRRYGYRGVVVDFDLTCRATQDWYQANSTRPAREQPWYHVLVHRSSQVTYAAQTSLIADDSLDPIEHPLVRAFFEAFKDGRYVRNERPWPQV